MGLKYDHVLILSTHALYLISKMKLKFKIMFGDFVAIIKSNQSGQFLFKFLQHDDFRL